MNKYICQLDSWHRMNWDSDELILPLGRTRLAQGELLAKVEHLGIELHAEQLKKKFSQLLP